MIEAKTKVARTGNTYVHVVEDGELVCDLVVHPGGKVVVFGGDFALRSGAQACSGAARPNWKRHRFERLP